MLSGTTFITPAVRDERSAGGNHSNDQRNDMSGRIHAHAWHAHPLGAMETWPQALRTAVGIMLGTRHPVFIFWGPQAYCFYNDAYAQSLGPEKHPAMLGAPGATVWAEIWTIIGPQIEHVMRGDGATWNEDHLVPIIRHGKLDEVYWTYSYSPIDDNGHIGGVLVLCMETTQRMLHKQREQAQLRNLYDMLMRVPSFVAVLSGPEHRFEFINDAYQRLVGHRAVLGEPLGAVLPEVVAQGFCNLLDDAYASGTSYNGRDQRVVLQRTVDAAAEEFFVDFIFQPICAADGSTSRILVEGYDVTDRLRTEAALRDSEARLRFLDQLTEATQVATEPERIMAIATRLLGEHMQVSVCAYADMKPDQDGFTIRGDWSAPGSASIVGTYSLADFGAVAVANLRTGQPLVTNDNLHDLGATQAALFLQLGLQATVCFPLIKQQRLTALMAVHNPQPRHWTQAELALVGEVTNRCWAHIERARAEAALRLSEQRFRGAIDAMHGTIWTNDADGRMVGEQPGWAALSGQSYAAYQNFGWTAVIHPDDAQATLDAWHAAVAARSTFVFEHRMKPVNAQEWRYFAVRAIPLLDAHGEVAEWVGLHSDITEQHRAREVLAQAREQLEAAVAQRTAALQESEARLRTILATSHLFQGLLTTEGILLDANAASLAAIKMRRDEVLGMPFAQTPWFTGTVGMPEMVQQAIQRVASGITETRAITVNLPTGVRSFDFSMRPVHNEQGKVVAIVPEAIETTARLKADEALRQTQKLEAVGQLTGGVAHDFNNLLTIVAGGLNLLERTDNAERRSSLMSRMREAVTRGATLTQQLLAFARKQELSPAVLDVAEYISGMRDLLARSLGANVRIALKIEPNLARLFVDHTALQLAILNLAVNARDAMPEGGTIVIKATNGTVDDAAAPFVSISVIDTGMGMSAEVKTHIFEPFFTTKEIGKGSGLGLAQVHGFAQQSGGYVTVHSALGAGTTVRLVLPKNASGELPMPKSNVSFRAERSTRAAGHILLVEDNSEVAALTREMLEHLGWQVTRVASAKAALGALANDREVDLVLSDFMMPGGMSGLELAHEARRRRPKLPIVLTSGYAESVRRDAELAGLPLLPKPFNVDTLAAILDVARLA